MKVRPSHSARRPTLKASVKLCGVALAASFNFALALHSPAALAHGMVPHINNDNTIRWEQDGTENGSVNHNHLFDHDIQDRVDEAQHHSHDAFASWTNRNYTMSTANADNFWHGFIEENVNQPRYRFSPDAMVAGVTALTADAQGIVNSAFNRWETEAHRRGPQWAGRRTGIDFDNDQDTFEFQIFMIDNLVECRGAAAEWLVSASQLNADTADGCHADIGDPWSNLDASNLLALAFDDDLLWDYIGLDDAQRPGRATVDFATIVLHEIGHVLGLLHTPGDPYGHIMRESIFLQASNGHSMRQIETDSAVGAAELYTVVDPRFRRPLPEPSGVYLMAAGLSVIAFWKLRR